jgi:DNA polymerase III epsilon subunit-like protein
MAFVDPLDDSVIRQQQADEFAIIGETMNRLFRTELSESEFFGTLDYPGDYFVFDLETTGVNPHQDLIVEVGWAVVRRRQVVNWDGLLLDWTRCRGVDQDWLRESLARLAQIYAEKGRTWHIPYERLAAEGVDPGEGLSVMLQLLSDSLLAGEWIVGHNARNFDRRMIDAHAERFFNTTLPWECALIFDTGIIEKAAQLGSAQREGESHDRWLGRISNTRTSIQWNLDGHCAQKYHLAERFNLDVSQAHRAGYDCLLTYCLMETYRAIAEEFANG